LSVLSPSQTSFLFGKNFGMILEILVNKTIKIYQLIIGELSVQNFDFILKEGDEIEKVDPEGYFLLGSQTILLIPESLQNVSKIVVNKTYFVGDPILV